jgi:hypothetical protein
MNPREQKLALLLVGLITLTMAGAGGYAFVLRPIERAGAAEESLEGEIADLEKQVEARRKEAKRMAVARARSLPADKTLAEREYAIALRRLMDAAGVSKDSEVKAKSVDNSSRFVPELSKGKPIYTRVAYDLVFKKADMWMVKDFLEGYYRLGLLHQITALTIKKDDDPGNKGAGRRNNLTVALTTEAVILDTAEARKTLWPVPTAFAALGGGGIFKGMALSPEAARAVRPQLLVPTLSPSNRDYSLVVRKDPFNGPLPIESPPKPLKLIAIRDVKVKSGEKPSPVRVAVTGDAANGATFKASSSGGLFPEGALKVDPEEYAIELPATDASEGTATVTVVATSADGKETAKTTFKVSVDQTEKPDTREDISAYVLLIGATPRSDGTAWARVKDNANRLRYEIEAGPAGVKVAREKVAAEKRRGGKDSGDRGWEADGGYAEGPGVLRIRAEGTKTDRTLKVVAVDTDGLIVSDLKPGALAAPAPRKGMGMGGMGKGGFGWPPRQGHADPLAALGGNRAAAAPKAANPKLYRWEVGQPLSKLEAIPEAEAKKILKMADESGPVFDVAAAGGR